MDFKMKCEICRKEIVGDYDSEFPVCDRETCQKISKNIIVCEIDKFGNIHIQKEKQAGMEKWVKN